MSTYNDDLAVFKAPCKKQHWRNVGMIENTPPKVRLCICTCIGWTNEGPGLNKMDWMSERMRKDILPYVYKGKMTARLHKGHAPSAVYMLRKKCN